MKRLLPLVVLLVACASTVDPTQTILDLEAQRQQAQLHGDWQTIQKLNSPDFTEIAGNGAIRTAAQNAQDMRAGALKFETVEYTDEKVRVHGDTAFVTGIANRTGTFNGAPFEQHLRYTRIYVREHGEWRVVFAQNTRIEPPATR